MVPNFNSIKVQLEPYIGGSSSPISIFQFHKGTIRTSYKCMLANLLLYFNSIKVQLEHAAAAMLSANASISIP